MMYVVQLIGNVIVNLKIDLCKFIMQFLRNIIIKIELEFQNSIQQKYIKAYNIEIKYKIIGILFHFDKYRIIMNRLSLSNFWDNCFEQL